MLSHAPSATHTGWGDDDYVDLDEVRVMPPHAATHDLHHHGSQDESDYEDSCQCPFDASQPCYCTVHKPCLTCGFCSHCHCECDEPVLDRGLPADWVEYTPYYRKLNPKNGPFIDVRMAALSFNGEKKYSRGCFYFTFYSLYTIVLFGILLLELPVPHASDMIQDFRLRLVVAKLNNNLDDIYDATTPPVFWNWMRQVWAQALFNSSDYNNTGEFYMDQNLLVSSPTLRQHRFKEKGCAYAVPPDWPVVTGRECFGGWSTAKYGPNNEFAPEPDKRFTFVFQLLNATVPTTSSCANCEAMITTVDDALAAIDYLESSNWFDEKTAYVEVSTVFYNRHYMLLGLCRIVFVQTKAGRVIPVAPSFADYGFTHRGSSFFVGRMSSYGTPEGRGRLFLEIVFVLFTVVCAYLEFHKARISYQLGFLGPHLITRWLDLGTLALTVVVIIVHIWVYVNQTIERFAKGTSYSVYFTLTAVLVMLFTFRVLKHIGFNPRWQFLSATLRYALGELRNFFFLFLLLLIGYAFAGNYYYGPNYPLFNSLLTSLQTVSISTLDNSHMEFDALLTSDSSFGVFSTAFYFTFIVIIFFIMVNMFLAVIMGSYDAIKEDLNKKTVPRRLLRDIWTKPYHLYVVNIFQEKGWVDVVYPTRNVGLFCSFQLLDEELVLRLKFNPLVARQMQKAQKWMIQLSPQWELSGFREEATFTPKDIKNTAPYTLPITLVAMNILEIYSPPTEDGELAIPLRLSYPVVRFASGPLEACLTRSENIAFGVGCEFKGEPIVVRNPLVSYGELRQAPTELGLGAPKHRVSNRHLDWDEVCENCAKYFPPDYSNAGHH